MKTIRHLFAVMLMGLAFTALQADAQSRSRTTSSQNRQTAVRSSGTRQARSSSSSQSRQPAARPSGSSVNRQPANKPSASVQSRPSSTQGRPSAARPSSSQQTRPSGSVQSRPYAPSSDRHPASRPSVNPQTKPSSPSVNRQPEHNRPESGAVNDRRPSNTVGRPGSVPGGNRPPQSHGAAPQRPSPRPAPGHAFRPDNHRPPVKVHPGHHHDKPRIHPVHRDFIVYDRPVHFWKPSYHYFGHRVRILPARARVYTHFGVTYYCHNDIWYRPYGGYYVVCRPPFGTVLAANLIADIAWTAVKFSYYNTVVNTFRQINENNSYIAEQNAIIAKNNETIAAQNQTIAMNAANASAASAKADRLGLVQSYADASSEYFYQDGIFYSKAADGQYKVIVPPAGALVDSLPDDYEMVTLDGNEYYKVDDTVYKVVLNDGKPYFEVMGQLMS